MLLKLSIITINYNNLAGLRKTVESVLAQTYYDFEYIIIDGASTDGSREYVNTIQISHSQADTKLANLHIVSEPDTGIYNAMNKGIRLAHGEYCLFLNSGDYFFDKNVVSTFCNRRKNADIFAGKAIEDGTQRVVAYSRPKVTLWGLFHDSISHQGMFVKRSLFDSVGLYAEDLKILSDYEFLLKSVIMGVVIELSDMNIAFVEPGGISNTQLELIKTERQIIFSRTIPQYVQDDFVQIQNEVIYNNHAIVWMQKSKWLYDFYCVCSSLCHKMKCKCKKFVYGEC